MILVRKALIFGGHFRSRKPLKAGAETATSKPPWNQKTIQAETFAGNMDNWLFWWPLSKTKRATGNTCFYGLKTQDGQLVAFI